jgi:hypothetical protein
MPRKSKFNVGDFATPNTRAPRDLRGRTGIVMQIGPIKGEYGVEFVDGRRPSLVYVEAVKLNRVPGLGLSRAITMEPRTTFE